VRAMQSRVCRDSANGDTIDHCDDDTNGSPPCVITCALSSCSAGEEVAALLQQVRPSARSSRVSPVLISSPIHPFSHRPESSLCSQFSTPDACSSCCVCHAPADACGGGGRVEAAGVEHRLHWHGLLALKLESRV
jgi:hypothetical protein